MSGILQFFLPIKETLYRTFQFSDKNEIKLGGMASFYFHIDQNLKSIPIRYAKPINFIKQPLCTGNRQLKFVIIAFN